MREAFFAFRYRLCDVLVLVSVLAAGAGLALRKWPVHSEANTYFLIPLAMFGLMTLGLWFASVHALNQTDVSGSRIRIALLTVTLAPLAWAWQVLIG